jgi:hypothetical protein
MNAALKYSDLYSYGFTDRIGTLAATRSTSKNYQATRIDYVEKFYRALKKLAEDTKVSSNPMDFVKHHAFREILSIGEKAVPLVISEISTRPSLIVLALPMLTGTNVVTPDVQGNLEKISSRWIEWYRRGGRP